MSAWLEGQCGGTLTFADFVSRDRKHPFEIEHVWANHPERHPELPNEQAFLDQRNRLGGLLLLPKDFNASYGDKPYADKVEHYFGQNVLAKSLHPKCYEHNPTFLRLRDEHALPFSPIDDFTASSFGERQALYQRLCDLIWDPSNFGIEVPEDFERTAAATQEKQQRYYGVSLKDLLDAGLLRPGQALVGTRNGVTCAATSRLTGRSNWRTGHERSLRPQQARPLSERGPATVGTSGKRTPREGWSG